MQVRLASKRRPAEITFADRDALVRRIRHLESAKPVITKLDAVGASRPVEFTDAEKGFLVVAIKAWTQDAGRERVPGAVVRLRDGLLDDLRGTKPPEIQPVGDLRDEQEPTAASSGPSPEEIEARSRLLSVADVIGHELAALHDLGDARLEGALRAMENARDEIVATVDALGSPPPIGRH